MTLTNCARLVLLLLCHSLFSECTLQKETKHEAAKGHEKSHDTAHHAKAGHNSNDHATVNKKWDILVTTYNTGGKMPTPHQFSKWFELPHYTIDLVVVGLQETTEMKWHKYFLPRQEKKIISSWIEHIKTALNQMSKDKNVKYELVNSHELVALFLAIFVKTERKSAISQIHTDHVETGVMNVVGNKGGVGISMTLDNSAHLVFVNSHIMHGPSEKAMKQRNENFRKIKDTLNFRRKNKKGTNPQKIEDHHLVFWMGDLNYRLTNDKSVNFQKVDKACTLNKHDEAPAECLEYLCHDELLEQKKAGNIFKDFHEGDIDFRPTYKFELNKNTYTGEKEKLLPAWCDRILFKTEKNSCKLQLKQKTYGSMEAVTVSDHKPVYAVFQLTEHIVQNAAGHCEAGKVLPLNLSKKPCHQHGIKS